MMFVQRRLKPLQISKELGGKPAAKSIERWAFTRAKKGKNKGKTWVDLRDEQANDEYELMTPESLAFRILDDIKSLYNNSELTPERRADALVKLYKPMEKLLEPKLRVNALFATLKDFVAFVQDNYPQIISDDFTNAIRTYKDERLKSIVRN